MQKENPNPIVHSTNKRSDASRLSTAPSLGSAEIYRYNLGSPSPTNIKQQIDPTTNYYDWNNTMKNEEDMSLQWGSITAEDRSVTLALSAAAYAAADNDATTAEPKLDILQKAGFALFHPSHIQKQCRAIQYPSYAPSVHTKINQEVVDWEPIHDNDEKEEKRDEITANEVFDIIRNIQDPEHPLTLEQLNVARLELIEVVDLQGKSASKETNGNDHRRKLFSTVHVQFTPTIPHCSMATLIGLSIRVKLLRSLPSRFKVVVKIEGGTHVSEHAVNKQLADKERVRAALENEHLLGVVDRCISGGMQMQ